jgi:hypothetical protein
MLSRLLLAAPLVAISLGASTARAEEVVTYPRLHEALAELREARAELQASKDNYPPGLKDQALAALDNAAKSIKVILKVKGDDVRGLNRNSDFYKAFPDHPRLRAAQHDLRQAHGEVLRAQADFGKYREQALEDIEVALGSIALLIRK